MKKKILFIASGILTLFILAGGNQLVLAAPAAETTDMAAESAASSDAGTAAEADASSDALSYTSAASAEEETGCIEESPAACTGLGSDAGTSPANTEIISDTDESDIDTTAAKASSSIGAIDNSDMTTTVEKNDTTTGVNDNPLFVQSAEDGWASEADQIYYYVNGVKQTGWLISSVSPSNTDIGLERYWLKSDGALAVSEMISADEAGWAAYARPEGYVVRGKYVSSDGLTVYLADNDGKLENPGWHVTASYDGELRRYYINDGAESEADKYKAVVGEFSVDGQNYYGLTNTGYELTNAAKVYDGSLRYANDDGVLKDSGWVVTDAYGQGLQRYWFQDGKALTSSLVDSTAAGWDAYAGPLGYVVRGKYVSSDGLTIYLADNDGKLEAPGWHITAMYDDELRRYYINDGNETSGDKYKAVIGEFAIDGQHYYGLKGLGYELTEVAIASDGSMRAANNDGVLTQAGWIITSGFGQGLQRYWFQNGVPVTSRLVTASEAGWNAYARPEGYVVRGKYVLDDGTVYLADNDGKLEAPGWLITTDYDNGYTKKYYIDEETHAARAGLFSDNGEYYYGVSSKGCVLTSEGWIGDTKYYADSEGRILPVISTSTYDAKGESAVSKASYLDDVSYLFLPSYADIKNVKLDFTRIDGLTTLLMASASDGSYTSFSSGAFLDLTAMGLAKTENGAYMLYLKQSSGSVIRPLAVMISGNIRTMYIISDDPVEKGREYIASSLDHSTTATGQMQLINADGTVVYDQGLDQIKGRGNTSWTGSEKKPYQIKLSKKTDLLETGLSTEKNKTWCLLAEAFDATLIHNASSLAFAKELGIPGTCGCAYIDLYYDGEYRGTYLLTEKIEINNGRIAITDLEKETENSNKGIDFDTLKTVWEYDKNGNLIQYVEGITDPADITGGYLLELDSAYYSGETSWFTVGGADSGLFFVSKSPEYLSKAQAEYICGFVQELYDCLENGGINPTTGKSIEQYLDIDSFAKNYLLNELTKVLEYMYSSSYFYKDSGNDMLYACSPWDFDRSGGVRTETEGFNSYNGLYTAVEGGALATLLLNNPTIQTAVKSTWQETVLPLVNNVLLGEKASSGTYAKSLAALYDELSASRKMNYTLWTVPTYVDNFIFATYDQNYEYYFTWLSDRSQWLANEISSWDGSVLTNHMTEYEGIDYTNVYDYQYYSQYEDLINAGITSSDERTFLHFIEYGMSEGRKASKNFDPQAYRYYNADLNAAYGNDWKAYYMHYIIYGRYEGRCSTWREENTCLDIFL